MILRKDINIVLASALVLGFLSTQAVAATGVNKVEAVQYSVSHVKENDNLNVRSGAGVNNEVVTTIPFDGGNIELLGDEVSIGKTRWALIKWKGVTGWVSKYYLTAKPQNVVSKADTKADKVQAIQETEKLGKQVEITAEKETATSKENKAVVADVIDTDASDTANVEPEQSPQLAAKQDVWILQCGNKSPYWKVELHPKWMNVFKGQYETGLHIIKKKQDKNRWNTALKTVVHGRNGQNNLKMTIKYAYAKRCYDTLSGLRVPYKVTTQFNGEELTGCCRAVKTAAPDGSEDTKLSMNTN